MSRDRLLVLLLAVFLFVPFLGTVHLFDWDEINFAESAREMLQTGNWWQVTINYEPFREKPPLFFWMQALSMTLFGVGEFAARLPNALCGIITLQVIFSIGLKWQNRTFAWAWVLLYVGSFLPHLYFKSGIIDPWFNLFIFLSIYHLFITIEHSKDGFTKHSIYSGLFSGLAILTNGPVGFLLLFLTFMVWWSATRFKRPASWSSMGAFTGTVLLVSSVWFGYETIQNGPWFLVEFIQYQAELFLHPVAGHKQPFFYHFLVVLLGCFPLSIIAIPVFRRRSQGDEHGLSKWMKYLFWVVLILFSIVTTKIVHYSSMTYLPLSYLAALIIARHAKIPILKRWQTTWITVQGILLGVVFMALPIIISFKDDWIDLINDPFAKGNLSADVNWLGWEWIIGVFFIFVIISAMRLKAKSPERAFLVLTLGTALVISGIMMAIVPKVEGYSQRSAIAFFEAHQNENAHFELVKYKSYSHYFYGQVTPESSHLETADRHYLICKIQHVEHLLEAHPTAVHLYNQGGFSFYEAAINP